MSVYKWFATCPQRPVECVRSSETVAMDGDKPSRGAGDQTQVLCKNDTLLITKPSLFSIWLLGIQTQVLLLCSFPAELPPWPSETCNSLC